MKYVALKTLPVIDLLLNTAKGIVRSWSKYQLRHSSKIVRTKIIIQDIICNFERVADFSGFNGVQVQIYAISKALNKLTRKGWKEATIKSKWIRRYIVEG